MPIDPNRVQAVFLAAVELTDGPTRNALLDRECGSDAALRERVERLLAAHREDSFLNTSAGAPGPLLDEAGNTVSLPGGEAVTGTFGFDANRSPSPATVDVAPDGATASFDAHRTPRERSPAMSLGTVIAGRYTLDELIGEGGMGSVFLATQTEPVKRQVALKLIKAGMDSKGVLARFDAERQALALMDHPNIARIYDGGVTPSGQPFFVMELVKGVPLTEYCDTKRLTVDARLQLFIPVCQAVQHAHQKGIIHRDLKPGNVLVTEVDGRAMPKVIDFGVAKATEQKLTDQSLSDTGAIVGTPAYMSPEQADPSSMDIDTRTDVYALGVMLYELLTGSPPIDSKQFKRGAILEMLRMVREVEPPRPSTKLSTADALPNIAANRSIEPSKLSKLLQGELDWVVMKALEKDRTRRYETANGLARDLQRYLADEVVEARPPSRGYRLKKFVSRNRSQVIAAGLVLLVLVGGVIGTTWGLLEARREAVAKEAARADQERQRIVAEERRAAAERAEARTADVLDAMVSEVTGDSLATQRTISGEQKKFLTQVLPYYEEFARSKGDDPKTRARMATAASRVGTIEYRLGRFEEGLVATQSAREGYARLAAEFPTVPEYRQALAQCHIDLGDQLRSLGRKVAAEEQYNVGLALYEKLVVEFPTIPEYRSGMGTSLNYLADLLRDLGKEEEAIKHHRKALVIREKLAAEFPTVAQYRNLLAGGHVNLGAVLLDLGQRSTEAEEQFKKGLVIFEKMAAEMPTVPLYRSNLANCHHSLGLRFARSAKWSEAEQHFRRELAIREKLAADFPAVPDYRDGLVNSHNGLGSVLNRLGHRTEAEQQFRWALVIQEKLVAEFPAVPGYRLTLGGSYCNFGSFFNDGGKPTESLAWYDKAIATLHPLHEADIMDVYYQQYLGNSYRCRAIAHDRLRKYAEAVGDWDRAIDLSPVAEQPTLRSRRVTSRLNAGMVSEAVSEVNELAKSPNWNASQWYEFAGVYAVASRKVADKKSEYADRAMELLQSAVKAGYKKVDQLMKDTDLDPLRDRDDFKKLLADLEKRTVKEVQLRKSLASREKMAADFPAKPDYRRDLAGSHNDLGILLAELGKRVEAEEQYRKALALREKLVADFPAVSGYQRDLAGSYCNLGIWVRNGGQAKESLEWFEKAINILLSVRHVEPRDTLAKQFLRNSFYNRAMAYEKLQDFAQATKDWDRAVELCTPDERALTRSKRAMSRLKAGMVAEAVAEVAELTKLPKWTANQWYNFACIYAVASGKIADKKDDYGKRAMELLQSAVQAGYKKADHMKTDPDLNPLRKRADFKSLMAELEAKAKK